DGVIPARVSAQCVEGMRIFQETLPRALWRSRGVVKIDILVSVVCAQADHVALVSDDVDECVLPIEAADSRITLANGLPGLDGKAERRGVSELETYDWMRNPRRTPVINGQVDTSDFGEPHRPAFPSRRVIRVSPVIAVADVMKSKFIAVDFHPRQLRHVGLPVTIVTRLKCKPPDEHQGEPGEYGS